MKEDPPVYFDVLQEVERRSPCTLDELVLALPHCTWNRVFAAVDSLSREGSLSIRRGPRDQYLIALAKSRTVGASRHAPRHKRRLSGRPPSA
jgi:hypothetical protein